MINGLNKENINKKHQDLAKETSLEKQKWQTWSSDSERLLSWPSENCSIQNNICIEIKNQETKKKKTYYNSERNDRNMGTLILSGKMTKY